MSSGRVTALMQDLKGNVWIGANGGEIGYFNGQAWEILINEEVSSQTSSTGKIVSALVADHSNAVWAIIGSERLDGGRLWQYVNGTWFRHRSQITSSVADKLTTRLIDRECWDKDISNVSSLITDGVPYIPGRSKLIDLTIDRMDHLWITSRSDRMVFKFDGNQVSCWNDGLFDNVRHEPFQLSVLPRGDIVLMLVTSPPAVFRFNDDKWSRLAAAPAATSTRLSGAPDGSLWAGADDGLYRYSNERWDRIVTWDSSMIETTQAVQAEGNEWVWVIVKRSDDRSDLLQVSRRGEVVDWGYPHDSPMSRFSFVGMVFDEARHQLWIGDEVGVHRLDTASATAASLKTWGHIKAR